MTGFELLTERKDIRAAQQRFEQVLNAALPLRPGTYTVGYPGGNHRTSALRANSSIWYFWQKIEDVPHPRYWNAFGLVDHLVTGRSNDITVEINSPIEGAVRSIGGMFAREPGGGLAVLHSGKVGGGRSGIGKAEFLAAFKGMTVLVSDPTRPQEPREALLLARLDDPNAARNITRFVLAVARFKSRSAEVNADELPTDELRALAEAASKLPKRALREVMVIERNPFVSAYAKRRAKGRCDLCSQPAPFAVDGKPFLECHHIQRLADDGADDIFNTVALCPNCHRRMHFAPAESDFAHLRKQAARRY